MTGLSVYTTDYEPRAVYAGVGTDDRDRTTVERAVRFGDRPLDLYVRLDDEGGRVLCPFRGKRGPATNRTEYFLADYGTDDSELFRDFAAALTDLHDDGWTVPYAEEPRWNAGFDLWRVQPATAGLSEADRQQLFDHVADPDADPVEFGVADHHSAFEVVRALSAADITCRVAVGTDGDRSSLPDLDLLLVPDGSAAFDPRSASAERLLGTDGPSTEPPDESSAGASDGTTPATRPAGTPVGELGGGGRVAAALVVVLLGFSCYSFVSKDPVHPISGLAAFGGLAGAAAAFVAVGHLFGGAGQSDGGLVNLDLLRFRERPRSGAIVIACGTLAGFLFPTVFRVGGRYLTGERWLFGGVSSLDGAGPSVALYVFGLLFGAAVTLALASRRDRRLAISTTSLGGLFVGHLLYATAVLLSTGLASDLWFRALPSVN